MKADFVPAPTPADAERQALESNLSRLQAKAGALHAADARFHGSRGHEVRPLLQRTEQQINEVTAALTRCTKQNAEKLKV